MSIKTSIKVGPKSDEVTVGDIVKLGIDKRIWVVEVIDLKDRTIGLAEYYEGAVNKYVLTVSFKSIAEYVIEQQFNPPVNIYNLSSANPNQAFQIHKHKKE